MTPELKTACEVVFQEHKLSGQPIKWDRDAFRGRISIGLCEMAKETLVKKNIIILPKKSKKVVTQLNPDVASADSFEEAEKMIATKVPAVSSYINSAENVVAKINAKAETKVVQVASPTYNGNANDLRQVIRPDLSLITNGSLKTTSPNVSIEPAVAEITDTKWWLKPVFLYFVWPACGAAGGALISFLMNLVYHLFFHP